MATPSTFVPDEVSDGQSFSAPSSFVPDEPSQSPAVTFHDPAETIAPLSKWQALKMKTESALGIPPPGSESRKALDVIPQAAMIAPLGLPERLGKLLMGYFTARTAYDQPAIARQIRDEVKQGDLPAAKRTAIEDLLNVGMVGTGIMGLRGGKQPAEPVAPVLPKGEAAPATFIPETPQLTGEPNARNQSISTSVPQREIRTRMGEEASLRQQGQVAETPPRPAQGGTRPDEVAAPPIEPVKPVLKPALLIDGKPVTGGNSHAEILQNLMNQPDFPVDKLDAAVMALEDNSKHVFVDQNKNVYDRWEGQDALGIPRTAEGLQSHDLAKLETKQPVKPVTPSPTPREKPAAPAQEGVKEPWQGEVTPKERENFIYNSAQLSPSEFARIHRLLPLGQQLPDYEYRKAADIADKSASILKDKPKWEAAYKKAIMDIGETHIQRRHEGAFGIQIFKKQPVNAEAVDAYKIELPQGYVREGDQYVFKQPTPSVVKPEGKPKTKAVQERESKASKAAQSIIDFVTSKEAGTSTLSDRTFKKAMESTYSTMATHAHNLGLEVPRLGTYFAEGEYRKSAERVLQQLRPEAKPAPQSEPVAKPATVPEAVQQKTVQPEVVQPTIKSPLSAFGKQFYKNTAGEWRQKGRPNEPVNSQRRIALEQLLKPKEPAMAEVGPGLGAAKGGEPPYQPLAQLTDSLSVLAKQSPKTDSVKQAFDLGKAASAVKDRANAAINGLKAVGAYMKEKATGYPMWNTWKAAIGDRHLALTQSVKNAEEFVRESQKTVPDKLTQEAISDYIDAGGKDDVLAKAESETKPQFQKGYTKARNLSPDEMALAENARTYFDQRLQDAIDHGILEDGIEDYIHRIYPAESPLKSAILSELKSGIFTGRPALAKQRVYEYDYEAEKAGLTPVKSFIKRIAAYDLSLNKAIADRQAVKAMTQIRMADGRPMVDVGGIGTKIEGEPPKGDATLIRPSAKASRPDDPKNDRGDYRVRDYAALKRWKWVSADGEGNPIFVKGDVLVHPDAVKQIDNLFKRSAIRQNPVGRAMLATGSTVKQTMLDLSGFHPVQITVHGWEHRTFKPVDKIDFDNHDVRGLVRGGLVVGETTGHELFSEGVSGGGSSLTRHIPVIGKKLQAYNHWLFNDYIPRLKVATGLHALARNRSKFPKLSDDELYHLTANEMNNAFGELNYDMIGRSKTTQDVMRIALLAPDFLEARAGFAAQAATKFGSEQRAALLLGAATLYVTARIINKLLDNEYHFEPQNAFSVITGKKAYSLRTVQGDILKAVTEPGRFISSRLNPVYGRTVMEALSGRDYFGRQRNGLQQLKDLASTIIPISGRGLLNPREQNLLESFMNAFGITNRRSTAATDVFQLAANFKKAHNIPVEPGDFVYDPDKDPYYGIKQAAVFSNVQTTENEIKKAIKAGHPPSAIWKHFVSHSSRPFTGSKKNDAAFYKELSDDDKKIYADAVNERKVTVQRFRAAWHLAHQQAGDGLESESQQPSESPLSE